MSRVKIEDLKPEARNLDVKEMKKLFGGMYVYPQINASAIQTQQTGIMMPGTTITAEEAAPAAKNPLPPIIVIG
jgi:hypothetical protein